MLKRLLVVVVPMMALASQASPAAADSSTGSLFGITGFGQSVLSTIDPATGAVTDIEDLAGPDQGQLVSVTGDPIAHRIYAMRSNTVFIPPSTIQVTNELLTINSVNGAYTVTNLVSAPPGEIVFDPSTGALYDLGFESLLQLDPTTGRASVVAHLANRADTHSMAVVPGSNRIYVAQTYFSFETFDYSYQVLTIDTLTGGTTASPLNPGRLGFLMYDPSAGLLLSSDNQNLYSVDPASGAESVISNFNTNPEGLFFFAGAVDPATNTVHLHLQVFDFFNPLDEVVAINDLNGSFSPSGNLTTSQLQSMYFEPRVTVTPDGIKAAVVPGGITKAGVAKTLPADLSAAQAARDRGQCKTAANIYQQFINDVSAQRGKSIDIATASRLTSQAEYLAANCP